MSIASKAELSVLSHDEQEMVRLSHHPAIYQLDSEALRRQGETMVRLTVVATMGLIGVATTGFWGMNLFLVTDEPPLTRFFYFSIILILAMGLTFYTVLKSRRLSDFLETLADEQQSGRAKLASLLSVWKRKLVWGRPE